MINKKIAQVSENSCEKKYFFKCKIIRKKYFLIEECKFNNNKKVVNIALKSLPHSSIILNEKIVQIKLR